MVRVVTRSFWEELRLFRLTVNRSLENNHCYTHHFGREAREIRTHLKNALAESRSRQDEAFRESFQRNAPTARPGAENSATRQIVFRFSSADGIASKHVRLVF